MAKRKIQANTFCEYHYISQLKTNKQGKVAFIKSNAVEEENMYTSDLYILSDHSGAKRLTTSKDVVNFAWLDDEHIIFPSKRYKNEKNKESLPSTTYYKISLDGGEAEEFMKLDYIVTNIYPIAKDTYLFTALYSKQIEEWKESSENDADIIKKQKEEADYILFDEVPFWSDGRGITNGSRHRLYLYEKGEIKPLTDIDTSVESCKIFDEYAIIIIRDMGEKINIYNHMMHLDLKSMKMKDISHTSKYSYSLATPISDKEVLAFGTNHKTYGLTQEGEITLHNIELKEVKFLDDKERTLGNSMNSDIKYKTAGFDFIYVNDGFYYIQTDNDRTKLMFHNIQTGETSEVLQGIYTISEMKKVKNDIFITAMEGMNGIEIYKVSKDNKEAIKMTNFNDWAYELNISMPQEVTFINEEDKKIYGWVLEPTEKENGKKYPTILEIHGEPKTSYGPNFIHEMQYLAAEGYGIIYCNPTGSAGRGSEFGDLRGKYGTIDYRDVMKFVDTCIATCDWIDGENIGVAGGSYGGFMCNWMIGHTNRFKAVVSQRSISNWISFSNTSDIGPIFGEDQMGTTTWENPEELWEKSPLKYANHAKTPTLFIHSQEDYRCWWVEAIQMYSALQNFNVDTKLVTFKGEGHELSRSGLPKHRVRRLEEIKNWFDKYLI